MERTEVYQQGASQGAGAVNPSGPPFTLVILHGWPVNLPVRKRQQPVRKVQKTQSSSGTSRRIARSI